MSAEVLREAAAKMRATAQAAEPGRWKTWGMSVLADPKGTSDLDDAIPVAEHLHSPSTSSLRLHTGNVDHIASWHPAVALAVADWLDAEATASDALALFSTVASEIVEYDMRGAAITVSKSDDGAISMRADTCAPALAVARAYLGESA